MTGTSMFAPVTTPDRPTSLSYLIYHHVPFFDGHAAWRSPQRKKESDIDFGDGAVGRSEARIAGSVTMLVLHRTNNAMQYP